MTRLGNKRTHTRPLLSLLLSDNNVIGISISLLFYLQKAAVSITSILLVGYSICNAACGSIEPT